MAPVSQMEPSGRVLKALWASDGQDAAIRAASEAFAHRSPDPRAARRLGSMLIEAGRVSEAAVYLMQAARDPTTRAAAFLEVAAIANADQRAELLSFLPTLPGFVRDSDAFNYACGLLLWNDGQMEAGLAIWAKLSPAARARVREPLRAAGLQYASSLVNEGLSGEALRVLESMDPVAGEDAKPVARRLILQALRSRQPRLAREAGRLLGAPKEPLDRLLLALGEGNSDRRVSALAGIVVDKEAPAPFRLAACRVETATRLRDGSVLEVPLPEVRDQDLGLVALLAAPDANARRRAVDRVDWARLRTWLGAAPSQWREVVGRPAGGTAREQASFFAMRGDHEQAYATLAPEQTETPWDASLARALFLLAFVRASRSKGADAINAWRDCFAQFAAVVENGRWLAAWVLERISVYGSRDDENKRAEELKVSIAQMVDRRLLAQANEGELPLAMLRAELARERASAAAMYRSAEIKSPEGEKLAFGPLFASRVGRTEWLARMLGAAWSKVWTGRGGEQARLLRDLGRGEREVEQALAVGSPVVELARWFSELGEAMSLRAAGDVRLAREAALGVYVRWSPPVAKRDLDGFASRNPGFAGLADGAGRLRAAAGAMVSEMSMASLREDISLASFDVTGAAARLRSIIGEAVALDSESEARASLVKLVLGKQEQLIALGTIEGARAACTLGREALKQGLSAVQRRQEDALTRHAWLLAQQKRYPLAASSFEEAWKLRKAEAGLASSWIAMLLRHHDRLSQLGRHDAAAEAIAAAERASEDAMDALPGDAHLRNVAQAVRAVQRGAPLSRLLKSEDVEQPKVPDVPVAALDFLSQAKVAASAARWDDFGKLGDMALSESGKNARVVAELSAALSAVLESAPTAASKVASPGAGDALAPRESADGTPVGSASSTWTWLSTVVADAAAASPGLSLLAEAGARLKRVKPLVEAGDAISVLHAKALRLSADGHHDEAAKAMRIVFALRPQRDAEVCLLLAECLARHARGIAEPDVRDRDVRTAEKVLAIAANVAPDHPHIRQVRDLIGQASGHKEEIDGEV